jgi:hypothetical protein
VASTASELTSDSLSAVPETDDCETLRLVSRKKIPVFNNCNDRISLQDLFFAHILCIVGVCGGGRGRRGVSVAFVHNNHGCVLL